MIRWLVPTLFAAAAALFLYLYVYLGASRPVALARESVGPLVLLYKDHIGPYHQINSSIQEVERWAFDHGLPCSRSFGEFLDDPEAVDQDRLRAHAGCVLPAGAAVDPGTPFHFETRARRDYVVARFAGAPSIGPFKVYPKAEEYLQEHRLKRDGPVVEIYRVNGNAVETEYLFPLAVAP